MVKGEIDVGRGVLDAARHQSATNFPINTESSSLSWASAWLESVGAGACEQRTGNGVEFESTGDGSTSLVIRDGYRSAAAMEGMGQWDGDGGWGGEAMCQLRVMMTGD